MKKNWIKLLAEMYITHGCYGSLDSPGYLFETEACYEDFFFLRLLVVKSIISS